MKTTISRAQAETNSEKRVLKTLSDLEPEFLKGPPVIVSCARCAMTMASVSRNALVDAKGYIVCRGCLTSGETAAD